LNRSESTARRSTLGSALVGANKGTGASAAAAPRMSIKDPRPLSDKQYLQECTKKVHSFLTEHGFDKPIKLRDPSVREYGSYLEFLFRFIDPKFAWKKDAHLDEEIPLMYKVPWFFGF
jgi:kinetochore protein NDC80